MFGDLVARSSSTTSLHLSLKVLFAAKSSGVDAIKKKYRKQGK
jgi:hypothetical protein